jgi:hypothetical protein
LKQPKFATTLPNRTCYLLEINTTAKVRYYNYFAVVQPTAEGGSCAFDEPGQI